MDDTMKSILFGLGCIGLIMWGVASIEQRASAKETTTLDEALDRPTKIERYVDKEHGVVCYWNARHPGYLTCVKVTNDRQRLAQ